MIERGDIFIVTLDKLPNNSTINGTRPVIVVSNNRANTYSSLVTVVPLTRKNKKPMPTHIHLEGYGLDWPSTVLAEQVLTISKTTLSKKIGTINGTNIQSEIDRCIRLQLDVA